MRPTLVHLFIIRLINFTQIFRLASNTSNSLSIDLDGI